jgi:hypothetical protein
VAAVSAETPHCRLPDPSSPLCLRPRVVLSPSRPVIPPFHQNSSLLSVIQTQSARSSTPSPQEHAHSGIPMPPHHPAAGTTTCQRAGSVPVSPTLAGGLTATHPSLPPSTFKEHHPVHHHGIYTPASSAQIQSQNQTAEKITHHAQVNCRLMVHSRHVSVKIQSVWSSLSSHNICISQSW